MTRAPHKPRKFHRAPQEPPAPPETPRALPGQGIGWGNQWLATLESFGLGSRLARGKSYADSGRVTDVKIVAGAIKARVRGRKLYRVEVRLDVFTAHQWNQIMVSLSRQAIYSAQLLAGAMPANVEEAFKPHRLSLFPASAKDVEGRCECNDWANPCKHVAAVHYVVSQMVNDDPFLLFRLRGKPREQFIADLRRSRAQAIQRGPEGRELIRSVSERRRQQEREIIEHFWQCGPGLGVVQLEPREADGVAEILRSIGKPGFWESASSPQEVLAPIYRQAGDLALELFRGLGPFTLPAQPAAGHAAVDSRSNGSASVMETGDTGAGLEPPPEEKEPPPVQLQVKPLRTIQPQILAPVVVLDKAQVDRRTLRPGILKGRLEARKKEREAAKQAIRRKKEDLEKIPRRATPQEYAPVPARDRDDVSLDGEARLRPREQAKPEIPETAVRAPQAGLMPAPEGPNGSPAGLARGRQVIEISGSRGAPAASSDAANANPETGQDHDAAPVARKRRGRPPKPKENPPEPV